MGRPRLPQAVTPLSGPRRHRPNVTAPERQALSEMLDTCDQ
ncbi:hypothetical protein [Kitasatospora sp. NPDC098663]